MAKLWQLKNWKFLSLRKRHRWAVVKLMMLNVNCILLYFIKPQDLICTTSNSIVIHYTFPLPHINYTIFELYQMYYEPSYRDFMTHRWNEFHSIVSVVAFKVILCQVFDIWLHFDHKYLWNSKKFFISCNCISIER